MFYIRELSGIHQTYRPGAIRERRAVRAVPEVNAIESSANPAVWGTQGAQADTGAREVALDAYARAQNPDGKRRRVIYAADLMTAPVVTVSLDARLPEVQDLFSRKRFRHIPVVSEVRQVEGILSDRDLLRLLAAKSDAVQDWRMQFAKDLMVHPVLLASEDSEVREIARVMFEERVGVFLSLMRTIRFLVLLPAVTYCARYWAKRRLNFGAKCQRAIRCDFGGRLSPAMGLRLSKSLVPARKPCNWLWPILMIGLFVSGHQ